MEHISQISPVSPVNPSSPVPSKLPPKQKICSICKKPSLTDPCDSCRKPQDGREGVYARNWYQRVSLGQKQLNLPFKRQETKPNVDIDNVQILQTGLDTVIMVNGEKQRFRGLSPYQLEKLEKGLAWRKQYNNVEDPVVAKNRHNSANAWIDKVLRGFGFWRVFE